MIKGGGLTFTLVMMTSCLSPDAPCVLSEQDLALLRRETTEQRYPEHPIIGFMTWVEASDLFWSEDAINRRGVRARPCGTEAYVGRGWMFDELDDAVEQIYDVAVPDCLNWYIYIIAFTDISSRISFEPIPGKDDEFFSLGRLGGPLAAKWSYQVQDDCSLIERDPVFALQEFIVR